MIDRRKRRRSITRRRFLEGSGLAVAGTAAAAPLSAALGSSSAWALAVPGLDTVSAQVLRRMARLLFPHDALSDDVYAEVIEGLGRRARQDAALAETLRRGVAELDKAAGGRWLDVTEARQIDAMRKIETGAFFQAVHGHVVHHLYNHRKVWALLGYPGSSLEFGGYLHRGFDDIDWLPEDE